MALSNTIPRSIILKRQYLILFLCASFLINDIGKSLLLFGLLLAIASGQISILKKPVYINILWIFYAIILLLQMFVFGQISIDNFSPFLFFLILPEFTKKNFVKESKDLEYVESVFYVLFYSFFVLSLFRFFLTGIHFSINNFYFFNKNTASMFVELLGGYLLLKNRSFIFFLLTLFTLIVIGGKSAFLLFFVFGVFLLNPFLQRRGVVYLSFILFSILIHLVWSQFPYRLIATLFYRLNIWEQAIQEILENLWIGNGVNSFSYAVNEFGLFGKKAIHNYYLQVLHAYGLGGISLVLIILIPLFKIKRLNNKLFVLMFVIHAMIDVGWVYGPGIIYGLILGLVHDE